MSRWEVRRREVTDPVGTLYCFPHAGGSPGEYARWADDLPELQIVALQLPGKGSRFAELPITRLDRLVDTIVKQVDFTGPFSFFGHSLGGLIAFETARALRVAGLPGPRQLLVSAAPAPPVPHPGAPIHQLPDAEFLTEIERRFGPLPVAVHASPPLLALTLRGMRADIELFETYQYHSGPRLDRPITAFVGDRDRVSIGGWSAHTSGAFDAHVLPGGHFYFRTDRSPLLRHLAAALTTELIPAGGPR